MKKRSIGQRSKARSLVMGLLIFTGMMVAIIQLPTEQASALIIESFEGGLGVWFNESNFPEGYWDVAPSSNHAFDGVTSISMWNHGMPGREHVWIKRIVPVPAGDTRKVDMTFQLYSEAPLALPQNVTAYIGNFNASAGQFTKIGETDQVAGWYEYSYSNAVTSGPLGVIYVTIGLDNYRAGSNRDYYFDYVILTNVSDDISPPLFTNLTPPDNSFTNNTMPTISANYTDPSGMNISTVLMKVDGIDVTGSSFKTSTGIEYVPSVPLTEGPHTVYIEARDASINRNYGNVTWNFTVDLSPPMISNLQPPDLSTTTDNTPNISADYADPAGINTSTVLIEVDGIDVTSSANVTPSNTSYLPATVLLDGPHDVYLEVRDTVNNLATASWSFTVDTSSDGTPPTITNLNPVNLSTINETFPQISANYSDFSGIDVTTAYLEVDTIDVTSQATAINTEGIIYIPSVPLSDGLHSVFLSVEDDSINHNLATMSWEFTVDSTPPATALAIGAPKYVSGGTTYFSCSTPFSLIAEDGTGTGVDSTWFRLWNASSGWSVLTHYISPFTVSGQDGVRYIEYNSTDNMGNHETAKNNTAFSELYLDCTSPITTLTLGTPLYVLGPERFVTNSTEFNLSALDIAGIDSIWYKIDVGGAWTKYAGNFTIASEGSHTIYFNATDNVGNDEVPKTLIVIVDNTPPSTTLSPGTPTLVSSGVTYFTSSTQFTLSATDAGSGVDSISYIVWVNGTGWTPWNPYSLPFTISGSDGARYVEYRGTDHLGNQEVPFNYSSISSLYLDNSPPLTTLTIGTPSYVSGPNTFISSTTEMNLSAVDMAGAQFILYRVDSGGPFVIYNGNFTISAEGPHTIYFNATDHLGNAEVTKSKEVVVDKTDPTTEIEIGAPKAGISTIIINTSTEITFNRDDGTGSGVARTMYRIDDNPYVQYTDPFALTDLPSGQHTIKYYSIDNVGNAETEKTENVFLDDEPPTAVAGPDVSVDEGSIVNFDASSSGDNSGIISDYSWTFTHGGLPITLDGVKPSYRFTEAGNYTVTLTVADTIGNSATDTMWVNVSAIEDSDKDGLPDWWEQQYFGNLDQDADDDPDKDGYDNLEEFDKGTDPTVADKEEQPSEFPWWIILVAVIIVLFLILLLLLLKRRKPEEGQSGEESEEETEEASEADEEEAMAEEEESEEIEEYSEEDTTTEDESEESDYDEEEPR